MWIPTSSQPDLSYLILDLVTKNDSSGISGPHHREWSSLIGIITAITGNILISFALNIQRYAHIRIDREYNRGRQSGKRNKKQSSGEHRNYGTSAQEEVAEERARLNATAPGPGSSETNGQNRPNGKLAHESDDDEDETDPLNSTFKSDETPTPSEKTSDEGEDGRKSYLSSPYWWAGIVLMTLGEAGNFLAYGFAPASVVSPLGVVALVSNCVIAPFMLKEHFRQRDFWGVLVAIGGAVAVVISAKSSETKMGPHDLWLAISRWEFLTYLGITTGAIISLMFASPKYSERTIWIDLGLVGLFGGYTVLSTKGVASLLSDTLWRTLTFPITYLLVAVLISSAFMQIRYINKALQNFNSTQVIPTQFVMFTISVIIGSAVLYRDFESATAARTAQFIGGCLFTFFGVYLITTGRNRDNDNESDTTSVAGEEGIHLIDEEAQHEEEAGAEQKKDALKERQKLHRLNTAGEDPRTPPPSDSASSSSDLMAALTSKNMTSSTSLNVIVGHNQWLSSTEELVDTPLASGIQPFRNNGKSPYNRSQSDAVFPPRTPVGNKLHSVDEGTVTFSPSRSGRRSPFFRAPSSPADPQTPSRADRAPSPPKADPAIRGVNLSPTAVARSSRKGSIGRLMPGPLLSPLSSSLSAVVAESLLRGEGTSRANRLALKRSRSTRAGTTQYGRHASSGAVLGEESVSRQLTRDTEPDIRRDHPDDDDADESAVNHATGEDGQETSQVTKRLRAMSDSFGALLQGKKEKDNDQDNGGRPETTGTGRSGGGGGED